MIQMVEKNTVCLLGAVAGLFSGVKAILIPTLVLIVTDFILGVATDIKASKMRGEKFGVRSDKLWKTINKLACTMVAIILCHLYTNTFIDWIGINVGKVAAGIISAAELYSILGHLLFISNSPVLAVLRKWFKKEIESKTGLAMDDAD